MFRKLAMRARASAISTEILANVLLAAAVAAAATEKPQFPAARSIGSAANVDFYDISRGK